MNNCGLSLEEAKEYILAIENVDDECTVIEIGETQKQEAIKYLEENPGELPVHRVTAFNDEISLEYYYNKFVMRNIDFGPSQREERIWVNDKNLECVSSKGYPYDEEKRLD